jgi:CRP-like cAMP-binding protein
MASRKPAKAPKASSPEFDLQEFLDSAGLSRTIAKYAKSAVIFSQGDPATEVMYLQQGSVKISVLSKTGKEAIVAMLSRGEFFGEGCLAGQSRRMATATAMGATTVLVVEKEHMVKMLHDEPELSDRFRIHMLARNIRVEEDLVDQLFNSSEKRLARTLLLMARYGQESTPQQVVHQLSQETLAEMVGTTRSRVNFFMNKFRDLGFIEYNGGLKVNSSLLSVVLHD